MARPMPSWKALEDVIAGEVVLSGSPAYKEWPKPFNARFNDVRPQAIVLCATPPGRLRDDRFCAAARSGGHCLAGRSVSRGVVIDVTPMHSVSVSGGVATVGAGARLGAVYESLQEQGLARGVPETGNWSCCAFVFVDQAAEDIVAVDLFGGWRSRYGLAL